VERSAELAGICDVRDTRHTLCMLYWDGKGFVAGFMRPKGQEKNIYESSEQ